MSETNAEDRFFAHQSAHRLMRVGEDRWIARTIGKKNAFGIECERFFRGRGRGNNGDPETILAKPAQDIFLDPIVIGHDSIPNRRQRGLCLARLPMTRLCSADHRDPIDNSRPVTSRT